MSDVNLITEVEQKLGLNSVTCPALLGFSKGNWSSWKNGRFEIPVYVWHSIDAHMRLSKPVIKKMIKARGISAG